MSEESLFHAARALQPDERAAYLEAHCPDASLRREIEQLLSAEQQAGSFLDSPATGAFEPNTLAPRAVAPLVTQHPGAIIAGKYKLLQLIGEGGMGEVWMAEQAEPVRRNVALKVIKAGMDTSQFVARFEAERQALALMDHPNIARVFDGGTTVLPSPGFAGEGTGVRAPFFVMELVKGTPITKYCDEHRLTIPQRLELFVTVCQAIQHAHQKGIIHRDIKPSNVLVAPYDGRPVVKVIDFGIAKATGQKLTDKTMFTEFGAVVGTLQYMSPEQAEMNNQDIDTRSDIYSLGVLLYEMLTGTTPLDMNRLRGAAMVAMLMAIHDEEPPKPSTRLNDSGDSLPSVAAQRGLEPAKLPKLMRGDLDWITMKALEKDRTRRYETANGLAMEIQRYLADEPVLAGPPSVRYRMRKFVRRNKAGVIAAAAVLLALACGIVGIVWGLVEANTAWSAEKDRAEGERLAKIDAQDANALTAERLKQIEIINATVFDIFTEFDIKKVKRGNDPVEYILAQKLIEAGKMLDAKAIHNPLVLANLQQRLGETLLSLGQPQDAIVLLTSAQDIRKATVGPEHPDTLTSMSYLAVGFQAVAQFDKFLPLFKLTLDLRKAKLGLDHPDTLISMNNLAGGYMDIGQFDKALPLYVETLALRRVKLAPNDHYTLTSMGNLAGCYRVNGDLEKAVPLFEETLKLTQGKLGPDHPETLHCMTNLALGYHDAGRLEEAQKLYMDALVLSKAKLGYDHPDTLSRMNNVAVGYIDAGQLDKAMPLYQETLTLAKARFGPEHPNTLKAMGNLADGYKTGGELEKALPLFEEVLRLAATKLGPEHADTHVYMCQLAAAYWQAKQLDKSIPLFEKSLKSRQAKFGRDHPDTLVDVANLGVNYKDAGRLAEGLPLLEEAYRSAKKHHQLSWVSGQLFDAYLQAGKPEQAAALVKETLPDARKATPPESVQWGQQLAIFGQTLLQANAFVEAEPLLRECLAIREKKEPDDWRTFNTKSMLGGALLGQKKLADAEPLLLVGYEGMKQRAAKIPASGSTRIPEALDRLVHLYTAWHAAEPAKGYDAKAAEWKKRLEEMKAEKK